jgi:hypothetical protein
MVATRTSECNHQVPVAVDSAGLMASPFVIAERPNPASMNPAYRLCVPIFDALTVSG